MKKSIRDAREFLGLQIYEQQTVEIRPVTSFVNIIGLCKTKAQVKLSVELLDEIFRSTKDAQIIKIDEWELLTKAVSKSLKRIEKEVNKNNNKIS